MARPWDVPPRSEHRRPGRAHGPGRARGPGSGEPPGLDRADWDRARSGQGHFAGGVLILVIVTLAALAAMIPLVLTQPGHPRSPMARPLASTTVAPGRVGGPLPAVALRTGRGTRPLAGLRPALLVLVPPGCACARPVHEIVGQADEETPVPTYLIAPAGDLERARSLAAGPAGADSRAVGYADDASVLSRTYRADPRLPTLLLVSADGLLIQEPLVFHPGQRIEGWLRAYRW